MHNVGTIRGLHTCCRGVPAAGVVMHHHAWYAVGTIVPFTRQHKFTAGYMYLLSYQQVIQNITIRLPMHRNSTSI